MGNRLRVELLTLSDQTKPMSAATVLLMQMRRIVRTFRQLGATHPAGAIIPAQHGLRQSFAFRRLVQRGVLVAVDAERFYMDQEVESRVSRQRRRILLVALAVIIVVMLFSVLFSR